MLLAARYTPEPLCLVAAGDKIVADGKVVVLPPLAVAGSAEKLIMASRGKCLSQHNSVVCPQRVKSAVNLVLCNFVLWEGKAEGGGKSILLPPLIVELCLLVIFLVSGRVVGWREGCWMQSLNTSPVCEWEGVRTGRECGLHRRGADRGDTGAEAAPVPAQYSPSRASSGSLPSAGICDGSPGQAHLQCLLHLFLVCRWDRSCWRLHLLRAQHGLDGPPGERGCWASPTLPRGSHSGRVQHIKRHMPAGQAFSPVNTD